MCVEELLRAAKQHEVFINNTNMIVNFIELSQYICREWNIGWWKNFQSKLSSIFFHETLHSFTFDYCVWKCDYHWWLHLDILRTTEVDPWTNTGTAATNNYIYIIYFLHFSYLIFLSRVVNRLKIHLCCLFNDPFLSHRDFLLIKIFI